MSDAVAETKLTVARQLARFAVGTSWNDLTADAQKGLKALVLDTIACAIGGVGAGGPVAMVRNMVDDFGGAPSSTLIGGGRVSPDRAALHNGAAVRYLDFNDSFLAAREGCHPSDNLAPVLAASEDVHQSGKGFLIALATAYQVQCRLTDRAPVRDRGFDHTTQGVYGVAAGVARALELDEDRATNAICIAGTAFNALRVTRTGQLSHWKALAFPMAAASATQATYLARHGVTGPAEVFEGAKGFMDVIAGSFDIDWGTERLDAVSKVLVKRYNAEAHSQSAVEGLLNMQALHGFAAKDVASIEVDVFDACFNIIGGGNEGDKHLVLTKEAADHSLPYILAVALLDGTVMPAQYAPERLQSEDVQVLLKRVHVSEDPALTARFPAELPVRLVVSMNDGTRFEHEQADFEGYPSNPMSWDRVVEKFRELTEAHASAPVLQQIIDVVRDLDRVDDVQSLTALLAEVRPARV